jgi:hypothetical protein
LHNSVSERCRSARFVVPDFNIESWYAGFVTGMYEETKFGVKSSGF